MKPLHCMCIFISNFRVKNASTVTPKKLTELFNVDIVKFRFPPVVPLRSVRDDPYWTSWKNYPAINKVSLYVMDQTLLYSN